jgi:hypothetical protein
LKSLFIGVEITSPVAVKVTGCPTHEVVPVKFIEHPGGPVGV